MSTTPGSLPTNGGRRTTPTSATPSATRYLWNGVWRRDFTRGIVLLNEPGASTKTLALGGTFKTTSGP